jgi:hypothetical protein
VPLATLSDGETIVAVPATAGDIHPPTLSSRRERISRATSTTSFVFHSLNHLPRVL